MERCVVLCVPFASSVLYWRKWKGFKRTLSSSHQSKPLKLRLQLNEIELDVFVPRCWASTEHTRTHNSYNGVVICVLD